MSGAFPDNNPKTRVGALKVPLHLVPPSAKHFLAIALANGADKYGPYNWRDEKISISVYKAACERHLDAFWDGEELASDSGVHHLAHAMACLALMLDAMTIGKLNDDRPRKGMAAALQTAYATGRHAGSVRAKEEVTTYLHSLNHGWDGNGSPTDELHFGTPKNMGEP